MEREREREGLSSGTFLCGTLGKAPPPSTPLFSANVVSDGGFSSSASAVAAAAGRGLQREGQFRQLAGRKGGEKEEELSSAFLEMGLTEERRRRSDN